MIWRELGSRSIEELVDLPEMTDPDCRATVDVLTSIMPPALFTDDILYCLVVCRMTNLSLEHGNSDGSCLGYVGLGAIFGQYFGDYGAGFRFGKLGFDLVERGDGTASRLACILPSDTLSLPGRDTLVPVAHCFAAHSTRRTGWATSPLRAIAAIT